MANCNRVIFKSPLSNLLGYSNFSSLHLASLSDHSFQQRLLLCVCLFGRSNSLNDINAVKFLAMELGGYITLLCISFSSLEVSPRESSFIK